MEFKVTVGLTRFSGLFSFEMDPQAPSCVHTLYYSSQGHCVITFTLLLRPENGCVI